MHLNGTSEVLNLNTLTVSNGSGEVSAGSLAARSPCEPGCLLGESLPSPKKGSARDKFYYPPEIANDLDHVDLPHAVKQEIFACAWEYSRSVIPIYTNWPRYVAFMRIMVMGTVAEFRGSMVDLTVDDNLVLGYDLDAVLNDLFQGTPGHEAMAREFRTFLLVTAEKASERRHGEFFRRYVDAIVRSPRQWFRMRDADALARFTIAAALACNDLDTVWFTDAEFEMLTELGDIMYDAVAFYKHRSEGETNNTFAYLPPAHRVEAFRVARELLWALDVAWASRPELQTVLNFIRLFGGPIHVMMRRYRFVEDGLMMGKPETDAVIVEAMNNVKLWNRVDAGDIDREASVQRYKMILARGSEQWMYSELSGFLEKESQDARACTKCRYRGSYGAETRHRFGGVRICSACQGNWESYLQSLPERAVKAFPEMGRVLQ